MYRFAYQAGAYILALAAGAWLIGYLFDARWAVTALTAAGGLLTLAGLIRGVKALQREHSQLVERLNDIDTIIADPSITDAEKTLRAARVLMPTSTGVTILYAKEWIRRLILEHAMETLRDAAVMTFAGIIATTAASAWGLWL